VTNLTGWTALLTAKLAIAASTMTAPNGPSCVRIALPFRLAATPSAAVLVLTVAPAAMVRLNGPPTVAPEVSFSVSVAWMVLPVVFTIE